MTSSIKRRILVIDDQESIHSDYRKIIVPQDNAPAGLADAEAELFGEQVHQRAGDACDYEIDSAYQGTEALSLVRQSLLEGRPYALAFCDIRMPPGCDGIQTIRQMWELDSELLVVICSAYCDYAWEDIVQELGRTDRFLILRKPFENIEVRQCAAAMTERWIISRTDLLTGLLNRRAFEDHLHREWVYAVRDKQPLSCVMVDLDYFKSVNDRFGHAAGDKVLKTLGAEISSRRRASDTVCRYGGEEICVLMPNCDEQTASEWADGLRQSIAELQITVAGQQLQLTASIGVSTSSNSTADQDALVHDADAALRLAKQSGRDRVIRASEVHGFSADPNKLKEYSVLFSNVVARDIMTPHVVCIPHDINVRDAAEMLLESGVNSAPVVDLEGRMVGVVSEKDIMEALGSTTGWSEKLTNIMTKRVIQYEPETTAQVIFEFLCRVQLRRVIVVENGKPIGIIRRTSFIRWLGNYLKADKASGARMNPRQHMLQAVDALADRTRKLCEEIRDNQDDVSFPVVSGVSAIEMVLSELLIWAGNCKQKRSGEKFAECI